MARTVTGMRRRILLSAMIVLGAVGCTTSAAPARPEGASERSLAAQAERLTGLARSVEQGRARAAESARLEALAMAIESSAERSRALATWAARLQAQAAAATGSK